ncbi:MAG TPA: VWA domain-containing protein, partial [Campylobacterales bacterium]|nr:VWA domain-containing protein [Campylobacterales bacterium]
MKKLLLSFLLVFATLVSAVADDSPKAVIVFDASGSMWGQIQGKTKIEIAKKALENVVKDWNPKVELGLTVYGHRKKGDCNDIESVIPVGQIDKNEIISTVNKIQPKGKTPIARSLKKVADELKYTEEKATIILISDGKESCDSNPCDVAKDLEKKGIDFVTHVIGFNVDKKTDKQLECIAKATGGEYFSAKNASALN